MKGSLIQRLVGLVCLVALAAQAGVAAWMVRCSHGDEAALIGLGGASHLEWGGCSSRGEGECHVACGSDDADGSDGAEGVDDAEGLDRREEPCEDDPIGSEDGLVSARAGARLVVIELCVMPLPVPEVVVEAARGVPSCGVRFERRAADPPLVLASIKTVVMVV